MQQRCLSVENTKVPCCRGVVLPSTQKIYSFFAAIILSWENLLLEISLVCYPPVIIGILIFCVILGTGPEISSDFKCTFFVPTDTWPSCRYRTVLRLWTLYVKNERTTGSSWSSLLSAWHHCAEYERGCLHSILFTASTSFSSAFSAVSCLQF